jgi:hypothetical protein
MALLLQIAAPTLYPASRLRLVNDAGDLSAVFGEHALCLSEDRDASGSPSYPAPKPAHHEVAACCFWHGNSTLALVPDAKLELVSFVQSLLSFTPSEQAWLRRLTGTIGARAPPLQA